MPIVFEVRDRIVRTRYVGPTTPSDIIDARQRIVRHPDFEFGLPSLCDLRAADMSRFDHEQMDTLDESDAWVASRRGRRPVALVVVPGTPTAWVASRWATRRRQDDHVTRVFSCCEVAEEWVVEGPGTMVVHAPGGDMRCVYAVHFSLGPFRAGTFLSWDMTEGDGFAEGWSLPPYVELTDPRDPSSATRVFSEQAGAWLRRGMRSGMVSLIRASPAVHNIGSAHLRDAYDWPGEPELESIA